MVLSQYSLICQNTTSCQASGSYAYIFKKIQIHLDLFILMTIIANLDNLSVFFHVKYLFSVVDYESCND